MPQVSGGVFDFSALVSLTDVEADSNGAEFSLIDFARQIDLDLQVDFGSADQLQDSFEQLDQAFESGVEDGIDSEAFKSLVDFGLDAVLPGPLSWLWLIVSQVSNLPTGC